MALESVTLRRFTVFEDSTLSLSPLTVLIGPNNAGKSSVLQALALLAQSVDQDRIEGDGQLVHLGPETWRLTRHGSEAAEPHGWEVTCQWSGEGQLPDRPGHIDLDISFRLATLAGEPPAAQGPNLLLDTSSAVSFELGQPVTVTARHHAPHPGPSDIKVRAERYQQIGSSTRPAINRDVPYTGSSAWRFPPQYSINLGSEAPADHGWSQPERLVASALHVATPLLSGGVADALASYSYVGPDRHLGAAGYRLAPSCPERIATAADVLNRLVYDSDSRRAVSRVMEAVFETGMDIEVKPGPEIQLVAILPSGQRVNAVHTGAGLLQFLWLALELELARTSTWRTLVTPVVGMEEPELHLHPAAQPQVAQLLADAIDQGTRLIVTTQSEHLLMSLLQLVAARKLRAQDIKVHYVDNGQVENLRVDDLGRLDGGLRGFFEADQEQLQRQIELLTRSG